jgi:hypothetical protein
MRCVVVKAARRRRRGCIATRCRNFFLASDLGYELDDRLLRRGGGGRCGYSCRCLKPCQKFGTNQRTSADDTERGERTTTASFVRDTTIHPCGTSFIDCLFWEWTTTTASAAVAPWMVHVDRGPPWRPQPSVCGRVDDRSLRTPTTRGMDGVPEKVVPRWVCHHHPSAGHILPANGVCLSVCLSCWGIPHARPKSEGYGVQTRAASVERRNEVATRGRTRTTMQRRRRKMPSSANTR